MVTPMFSKMQESWSKSGYAAREMITVISVAFSFLVMVAGQMVKMPSP